MSNVTAPYYELHYELNYIYINGVYFEYIMFINWESNYFTINPNNDDDYYCDEDENDSIS